MKVPYGKQFITEDDIEAVVRVLRSEFLTQGPAVVEFEKKVATSVDADYSVAFGNATQALHAAYKTLATKAKKKVLVTPLSFVASSNCVLYEGGEVEFVDIDPQTFNIDLSALEAKLSEKPNSFEGVIVVDFAGLPVDTEKLRLIANKYNLWIIEDACHALGGSFRNSQDKEIKCGSSGYADISIFSFHPVKHVATGEGGMALTKSPQIAEKLRLIRAHGIERDPANFVNEEKGGWYHEMQSLGFNYRMPDLNAALGTSQMGRIDSNISRRREIASNYKKDLAHCPITFQKFDEKKFSNAYHLFVIQTDRRLELYNFLKTKNIYSQVHYLPIYMHPFYQGLGFKKGSCLNVERYYEKCLSLPMYHSLSESEYEYTVASINEFFKI